MSELLTDVEKLITRNQQLKYCLEYTLQFLLDFDSQESNQADLGEDMVYNEEGEYVHGKTWRQEVVDTITEVLGEKDE